VIQSEPVLKAAYLYGLFLGRGRHISKQNRILIEFAHHNQWVHGIAHCEKCGWMATQGGNALKCKNPNCGSVVSELSRSRYDQITGSRRSIDCAIRPIFESPDCSVQVSTSSRSTHLILDFGDASDVYKLFTSLCQGDASHLSAHLSRSIDSWPQMAKIEFVNGLLDTAGFMNSGGWLPRSTPLGTGRMRGYLQIVKNWSLTVQVDNFLRREFDLPVHTIDWGHPNIRSSNAVEESSASVAREHQLKFFPEYYGIFTMRMSHKQSMFDELLNHNQSLGFDRRDDWFPPSPLRDGRLKPIHPDEDDPRLPPKLRRHFDAFWQINLALGCEFLTELQSRSSNPEVFALTGIVNSPESLESASKRLSNLRTTLLRTSSTANTSTKGSSSSLEVDTYEPFRQWMESAMKVDDPRSIAWITSSQNLGNILRSLSYEDVNLIEGIEELRIRPDIVGFSPSTQKFSFIESKITKINLREIGQLMGYCLVAQPDKAFLISTQPTEPYVLEQIRSEPDLLEYGENRRISLAYFDYAIMTEPRFYQ